MLFPLPTHPCVGLYLVTSSRWSRGGPLNDLYVRVRGGVWTTYSLGVGLGSGPAEGMGLRTPYDPSWPRV